ncbi:hypothetical protein Plec18167_008406 [Paecilomyces lecythidis]|uniref:NAD-dependent epimerase/dehydratase domain-containing protein n=1 Tax=Paecilomyces lecythidis TaxID=3004212 RepID=A0ABR3WXN8_9EURO
MTSPAEQIILLTGASGFLAAHILDKFLSKGYKVRGTVRSESSIEAIRKATNPQYHDKLSFAIVPDMQAPYAFDEAVQGVNGIVHSASPFVLQAEDMARDILDPAINGTLNMLKAAAAAKNPQLKRVIVTSSFAAIGDLDHGHRPGYTYSERDWNPATYEAAAKHPSGAWVYCASKALAERAAWDFVEKEKPQFSLSTICPPWIIGPNINTITSLNKLNESTQIIYNLINGSLTAPPPTDFAGYADVRDVAEAHLLAYEKPAAAGERFLIAAGNWSYQTACDIIRAEFPELRDRVPVGTPGAGEKEDVYRLDNSKAKTVLGLKFRSTKETVTDSVKTLLRLEKELK